MEPDPDPFMKFGRWSLSLRDFLGVMITGLGVVVMATGSLPWRITVGLAIAVVVAVEIWLHRSR